jgi:aquaporin Z
MYKKSLAELLGTFTLSLVVLLVVATGGPGIVGAIFASITLGLLVYTIGPVSGCHINPAVTVAQLLMKKISVKGAVFFITAQFAGALGALLVSGLFVSAVPAATEEVFKMKPFLAEIIGTFLFVFGIASVVYGKAKEQMSGFVVGGSLLLGVLVSSLSGAMGILNPAVALVLNYPSAILIVMYMSAPIIGAVCGFTAYKFLAEGE